MTALAAKVNKRGHILATWNWKDSPDTEAAWKPEPSKTYGMTLRLLPYTAGRYGFAVHGEGQKRSKGPAGRQLEGGEGSGKWSPGCQDFKQSRARPRGRSSERTLTAISQVEGDKGQEKHQPESSGLSPGPTAWTATTRAPCWSYRPPKEPLLSL